MATLQRAAQSFRFRAYWFAPNLLEIGVLRRARVQSMGVRGLQERHYIPRQIDVIYPERLAQSGEITRMTSNVSESTTWRPRAMYWRMVAVHVCAQRSMVRRLLSISVRKRSVTEEWPAVSDRRSHKV